MVSFHDNPEQYKSAAMLLQLDQEVRCQEYWLTILIVYNKTNTIKTHSQHVQTSFRLYILEY